MRIFVFSLLFACLSCDFIWDKYSLDNIDIEQVDSSLLTKRKPVMDSAGVITDWNEEDVLLKQEQTAKLVNLINDAECAGLYKYLPKYRITLYLKGNKTRSFRATRDLIKERSDYSFKISDTLLFDRLMAEASAIKH